MVPDPSPGDDVEFSTSGVDDLSIVVDIANVMGARADGWWKDRAGAARRLCQEIADLAARGLTVDDLPEEFRRAQTEARDAQRAPASEINWVLVLEGRARDAAASFGSHQDSPDLGPLTRLVLAPGSGDDAIAREVAGLRGCRIVVTADRELRGRCEQAGATVAGPRWLLGML